MGGLITEYKISHFFSTLTVTREFPDESISSSGLPEDLGIFLNSFQKNLNIEDLGENHNGFEVDEIELSLGVNASGSVSIIAKLEVGAQAGIKVKLKRVR